VTLSASSLPLGAALAFLLRELVDGPPGAEAYMLNQGDPGLLRSLHRVPWAAAAAPGPDGGASIAAHVDHLRYGVSLFNRWAGGEPNPFADADWGASWRVTVRSDEEWQRLREALGREARAWIEALETMGDDPPGGAIAVKGMIASVAHLAYHLGAIRQIDAATRGPRHERSA
jgi:hypothetical protein